MLKTLGNVAKTLLFPLTLTSFVCLGLTRGLLEVAKFSTEFVARRGLGITRNNGFESDYKAKTLISAIERVNSFSSWFYKKSVKIPFSFFAKGANEVLNQKSKKIAPEEVKDAEGASTGEYVSPTAETPSYSAEPPSENPYPNTTMTPTSAGIFYEPRGAEAEAGAGA